MNLNIIRLETFVKDAKRLYKKYKKLPNDLQTLSEQLKQNPRAGVDLGSNCYKIRLSNSSIPTGKSGGFRVIYYYYDGEDNLYLMTMFSKKNMESVSDDKVMSLLQKYRLD